MVSLYSSCLVNYLFGAIDALEFFFGGFLYVFSQHSHFIGMVLQRQAAVGGAYFVVGGGGRHFEYFVSFVQ